MTSLHRPTSAGSLPLLLALIPFAAFAQKDVIHSDWRLDIGALRPSRGMMRYYDRETKLAYAFHNDGNALLTTIRGADPAMARRMVAMGMVLTIDTLGRKKGGSTIEFPLPMHPERAGGSSSEEWRGKDGRGQGGHRPNMAVMNMRLNTQGFKGEDDGEHAASGEEGIQAHIDMDSMDVATYDVRVPFRSILGRDITAADTLKAWSIKVTVNPFAGGPHPHGEGERNRSGMDSDGDMAGGGGMGGGMGGRSEEGHEGGDPTATEPASFHVKFKLAFRP